jgi:hypothetical protein
MEQNTMQELPDKILSRKSDNRGRINLGSDYSNKVIKVAIVDSKEQVEPGDVIEYKSQQGSQYGLVNEIARDGEIFLKYARESLHPHEDEYSLIERTGDADMSKEDLIVVIEAHQ